MKTTLIGNSRIPEEQRQEYTARIFRVLKQGGMMSVEHAMIFGKVILFLRPPEADAEGNVTACYNYFEDRVWDAANYNLNSLEFCCSTTGTQQFSRVCRAVQVLAHRYEEGSESGGNSELVENGETVGWLNYLFDEQHAGVDLTEKVSTIQYLDCSEDDRAHFWTAADEMEFSGAMRKQMHSWDKTLDRLEKGKMQFSDGAQFAEALVKTLDELLTYNPSLMMFQNTFYDFLTDWTARRVQGAYQLLRNMTDRLRSDFETGNGQGAEWMATQIRRYFAVLSNYGLRDRVLGL